MLIPEQEYQNIIKNTIIICVDGLIKHNNRILLIKRNNEPAIDQYWFPGGRIVKKETIKQAALRKANEEVNLDCDFVEIVSIEETFFEGAGKMIDDVHTINICCLLNPKSIKDLKLDKLHSEYKWVTIEECKTLKLNDAVLNPIQKVLAITPKEENKVI